MTPRQQRRMDQKLARKAAKRGVVSEAKLAANRENAQLSPGPLSPEGKAIVSQNATKHA